MMSLKSVIAVLGAGAALAPFSHSPIRDVSRCPGQNAEVESAADPGGRYVYEEWIGCRGIGFARSSDGGLHFGPAIRLRNSGPQAWDPAIAVGPTGTVYVVFMVMKGTRSVPVVLASFDHGASFPRRTELIPRPKENWGDRPFIAAGTGQTVYLTWDYGPSDSQVALRCYRTASCAVLGGELNSVIQVSHDGGRTFGPMTHLTPGFPAGGGVSAPVVVDPSGRIDVLYQAFAVRNRTTLRFGPGHIHFTSSADGGQTWSRPARVDGSAGSIATNGWWIDGDLASDAAGNLYATWDTQGRRGDTGWLAYSTDHGSTWSRPIEVTHTAAGPNIVQAAGGPAGIAYVGWLARRPRGYAQYLRPFSITQGWLSGTGQVSRRRGNPDIWPGDTFGVTALAPDAVMLSWGGAVAGSRDSEIFATRVTLPQAEKSFGVVRAPSPHRTNSDFTP
jgi:hypothetical protein